MQYFFAKYIYVCTFKMQTRKMCAENITSKSNIATQNPYWRRGQTTRDSTWAYTVILHMHEHTCAPTPRVCCRHARHWYKLKAKLLLCIISYVATNKTSLITQIGSIYAYVCIYDNANSTGDGGSSRVECSKTRLGIPKGLFKSGEFTLYRQWRRLSKRKSLNVARIFTY